VRHSRHLRLGRKGILALVAFVTALGLLWALGRAVDTSHSAASDTQLAADLQVARATLVGDEAAASRRAAALARLTSVEQALAQGNASGLQAIAAAHPGALFAAASGARAGTLGPLGVTRIATVVAGGRTIGQVVTEAALDSSFLGRVRASLPAGSRDLVAVTDKGLVTAGPVASGTPIPAATPGDVRLDGHGYRMVSSPLASDRSEVRIVALSSRGSSFMSGWRLVLAVAATLAVLALVLAWTSDPSRPARPREPEHRKVEPPEPLPERRRARERPMAGALALLGETLGATHNVDALVEVIRDAAVEATGASGSKLVHGRSDPADSRPGTLKITLDHEPGGSHLILFPPAGGFTPGDANLAGWFGEQAGRAIQNARSHHVAEQHALTDELTGLANRRHFIATLNAEIARAERLDSRLAVVVTDLDNFKRINDRHGHPAGDEALRAFASALKRGVRKIDLPARIGGDEFAVLLPGTGSEGARKLAERLQGLLRGERGLPEGFTASFGIAHFPQASSADELLLDADACLYRAKEGGRDSIVVQPGDSGQVRRLRAS
jgi:diguanylate cyclase (GGDEF)-like protein